MQPNKFSKPYNVIRRRKIHRLRPADITSLEKIACEGNLIKFKQNVYPNRVFTEILKGLLKFLNSTDFAAKMTHSVRQEQIDYVESLLNNQPDKYRDP